MATFADFVSVVLLITNGLSYLSSVSSGGIMVAFVEGEKKIGETLEEKLFLEFWRFRIRIVTFLSCFLVFCEVLRILWSFLEFPLNQLWLWSKKLTLIPEFCLFSSDFFFSDCTIVLDEFCLDAAVDSWGPRLSITVKLEKVSNFKICNTFK